MRMRRSLRARRRKSRRETGDRMNEIMRMENICDSDYLKYANINVREKETVGLLGLNNAGKTELLRIMAGFIACEKGSIFVDDARVEFFSALQAQKHGIYYLHDENELVRSFTVAENVFVMQQRHAKGFVNTKSMAARCNRLLESMHITSAGIDIAAEQSVSDLNALQKLVVLIAKAVGANARLIIIDHLLYEFPQNWLETLRALFQMLKEKMGVSLVIADYQPASLRLLCDRIFMMRDGMVVGCFESDQCDETTAAAVMTGYRKEDERLRHIAAAKENETFAFRDVLLPSETHALSFEVHAGETVGLCCMAGDFADHFTEALLDMRRIKSGGVFWDGKELPLKKRVDITRLGIGIVSDKASVFANMELADNISLMAIKRFSPGMGIINKQATSFVVSESHELKGDTYHAAVRGMEMNKLTQRQIAIQRSIAIIPRVMIYLNLDRGLDHVSYSHLLDQIMDAPNKPGASVFISSNIHKLLPVCTKIYFIHNGRVMNAVHPAQLPYDQLLAYYMQFCRF